jgi:amino acid permease
MCVCSVQWWWTSSVCALSLIHHPQIEPVIKRKEKSGEGKKKGDIHIHIVTPAAVKWSIFIVRASVSERTNGRSQEKGRDKDGSTNVHSYIYIHLCPTLKSQMNRREKERERIARWSTLCSICLYSIRMYALANKNLENIV